ncbi:large ribosomal subunit protein mL39 isoform X2 [Bacillus rossius redtenbacheri]|uniref:large ribosomal subunit protein mL39 isoform X2 n=1 Tax=Bacillus rossius redtenbacheri TaxID=93214 RepID=UPI002FDCD185
MLKLRISEMTYKYCTKCNTFLKNIRIENVSQCLLQRSFASTRPTNAATEGRRSELFSREQRRQYEAVGRIEKIEVTCTGGPEDAKLLMNKNISTPHDCAQHLSQMMVQRSALAQVDQGALWDMHRPLESPCQLRLLSLRDPDPRHVNKAFWRTCCFLLGAVAERLFKDDVRALLHSFPSPSVKSGSFVYDVDVGLDDWKPSESELRAVSGEMVRLAREGRRLERLVVAADLALDMFRDNPHKCAQIPSIASQLSGGDHVVLYRCGQHVDLSRGPMVADTSFLGRCTVTAVHRVEREGRSLYRFQGVALPKGILLNHFAYSILEKRARNLNPAALQDHDQGTDQSGQHEQHEAAAQQSV